MASLTSMVCVPCRSDSPLVTEDQEAQFRPEIPDWVVVEREGIPRLERVFKFRSYSAAMTFTNAVGVLAESEEHHPAILTEWGRVTVSWWTIKIRGLHVNDFIMAAKTDLLFANAQKSF